MDVGIHTDVAGTLVGQDQHQICSFSPDPRQCEQLRHSRRHLAAVVRQEQTARGPDVLGLVAIEAHRIDQPFDPADGQLGQRTRA